MTLANKWTSLVSVEGTRERKRHDSEIWICIYALMNLVSYVYLDFYLCFFVMIPYFEFELSDELGLKDFLCGNVVLGSSIVVLLYYKQFITWWRFYPLNTKHNAQVLSLLLLIANWVTHIYIYIFREDYIHDPIKIWIRQNLELCLVFTPNEI